MSEPRITYHPRPGATSQGERAALAEIYRLILDSTTGTTPGQARGVLDCYAKEKDGPATSRPEDARKDQDARTSPNST